MDGTMPRTRIQRRNRAAILEAALSLFAARGYRGATLDQIAEAAGLSKPNLLYYFPSKEAVHAALLGALMDSWLAPLRDIDKTGEPVDELVRYVLRKLQMSRDLPRESRLFAQEILGGAGTIGPTIRGPLRALVDEKAALISAWSAAGRLAPLDPHHLIFSIWAVTQHYADFDVQVRGVLGAEDHFGDAATFLETFYRSALAPR